MNMDTELIRSHLERALLEEADWLSTAQHAGKLAPATALQRLQAALRIARLAHACDEAARCWQALARASRWGRALAAIDVPDNATLHWDDEGAWQLACTPSALNAPLAMQAMAAASLCGDRAALRTLLRRGLFARLVRDAQQRNAVVGGESFWTLLGEIFAAVVAGERPAEADFAACRSAFDAPDTQGSAFDPVARTQLLQPMLDCLQLLSRGDAVAWQAGMSRALEAHQAYFSDAAQAGLLLGFLSIELSAISALAQQRLGWVAPSARGLLLSSCPQSSAAVELLRVCPLRSVRDAREAHWRLDLDGAPRAGRSHVLRQQADGLVADYTVEDGSAADRWRALFLLHDEAPGLDAGELLAVSDLLAAQVTAAPGDDPGVLRGQRILLQESIHALEALLARFPANSLALPAEAFFTDRGRAIQADNPGQFDAARLRARCDAYKHLLAEMRGADAGQPALKTGNKRDGQRESAPPEDQAQQLGMAAIELLRQELTPLLHALGQDRDGSLTAHLRPRPEDYARAFLPQYAEAARTAFEAIWAEPPRISSALPGSELKLNIAPAGMLADDNALSWRFPGGYRSVAPLLNPHRVWVAWKLIPPGKSAGMAYDGLVWLDDHWAWFPKPYRVLAGLIKSSLT